MRSKFAPTLVLLTACYQEWAIEFPPLSEGTQTLLLQDQQGYLWLFAADAPSGLYLVDPFGVRLDHLKESTKELGVGEGPLGQPPTSNPTNTSAPSPLESYIYGDGWTKADGRIDTNGLLKVKACLDPQESAAEPQPPEPPACPGWATSIGGGCQPRMLPACPSGTARFSRDGLCRPLAVDCPTGPWPQLPAQAAHVLAGAAAGGDGTVDRPFASIAEAISAGATVIGLSAGNHSFADIPAGVTVIGLCPRSTELEGAGPIEGRVERVRLPTTTLTRGGTFDQVEGSALTIVGSVTSSRSAWSEVDLRPQGTANFDQTRLSRGASVYCGQGTIRFRELLTDIAYFSLSRCAGTFDGVSGGINVTSGETVLVEDAELSVALFRLRELELTSSHLEELSLDAELSGRLDSTVVQGPAVVRAGALLTVARSSFEYLDGWGQFEASEMWFEDVHLTSADLGELYGRVDDLEIRRLAFTGELDVDADFLRATDVISTGETEPGGIALGRPLFLRVNDGVIERAAFDNPVYPEALRSGAAIAWSGFSLVLRDLRVSGLGSAISVSSLDRYMLAIERFRFNTSAQPFALAPRTFQDRVVLRDGAAPEALASPGFCAPLFTLERVGPALCNALEYCQ